jgi:hypothetical protein
MSGKESGKVTSDIYSHRFRPLSAFRPDPRKRKRTAGLERKIGELNTELERLPADRQQQFRRELDKGEEH